MNGLGSGSRFDAWASSEGFGRSIVDRGAHSLVVSVHDSRRLGNGTSFSRHAAFTQSRLSQPSNAAERLMIAKTGGALGRRRLREAGWGGEDDCPRTPHLALLCILERPWAGGFARPVCGT